MLTFIEKVDKVVSVLKKALIKSILHTAKIMVAAMFLSFIAIIIFSMGAPS